MNDFEMDTLAIKSLMPVTYTIKIFSNLNIFVTDNTLKSHEVK